LKNDTMNFVSLVADLGRHLFGDEVVIMIQDIIKALGIQSKEGLKPIVCHHHQIDTGWHVVLSIPMGLCSNDIIEWLQYFEEQLHAYIEPQVKDNKVHLDIHTKPLRKKYPYHFNPADYPKMKIPIPIGVSHRGLIVIDLSKLPHLFLAGSTGSGKTTEVITIIHSMLKINLGTKFKVQIRLIDLKGLDFAHLENHITLTEDAEEAFDSLCDLEKEMRRRIKLLRAAGCSSWHDYKGKLPYLVLIIDELAELRDKKAQEKLETLVRLCRAAGISIIGACQRPSAKAWKSGDFREVISLFDARVCYRTVDTFNSEIVLGRGNDSAFTHVGEEEKGRGILKHSGETLVQSMYIKKPRRHVKYLPTAKAVTTKNEQPKSKPKGTPKGNRFKPE
jgi:DNA segregation ATPase FtsK/SpoIIIE, S-DNA-T family